VTGGWVARAAEGAVVMEKAAAVTAEPVKVGAGQGVGEAEAAEVMAAMGWVAREEALGWAAKVETGSAGWAAVG
jgi:hypothetical protein